VPAYPEFKVHQYNHPEQNAGRQYKSVDLATQWQPDEVDKGDLVEDQGDQQGYQSLFS
jgi:hypothetical protein